MNTYRVGVALFVCLTACSQTKFDSGKYEALSKSAFGDATGNLNQPNAPGNGITDDSSGSLNQPGEGDSPGSVIQLPGMGDVPGGLNQPGVPTGDYPGRINQPGVPTGDYPGRINQPDGTNDEIDLLLECSDRVSDNAVNLKRAFAENLPVQLVIDNKICTESVAEIKAIVEKKTFTIADAKRLCAPLVPATGKWANVSIVIDGKSYSSRRGTIKILYAMNSRNGTEGEPANQSSDALCDDTHSPLVVHVASDPANPEPVNLSAQEDGVYFDLLGARANHAPVLISWFTNREYRMLALPNADGRVTGIDQLFGDSTVGPDGRFADNGYAALAKYDGTTADGMFRVAKADGLIDRRDPVFARLRLWLDANFDGKAQRSELTALSRSRITYIDLDFSMDFAETDQYGNQTKMKSVVGYSDGSMDLIFDLWFRY